MTLGGNDAGFSKVVQVCILGIKGPDQTCDGAIDNAMVVLRSQDFEDRMNKVYDGIFERLGADYHSKLLKINCKSRIKANECRSALSPAVSVSF